MKANSYQGSWMWRKLLNLRDLAKSFYQVEIKSGRGTSFWYDTWSSLGNLFDRLGDRGCIDLRITKEATVGDVLAIHRDRRHRVEFLNKVEEVIKETRLKRKIEEEDLILWRWKTGFKHKFSSNETLKMLRVEQQICSWAKGVWFSEATPKFAFLTWLAMHNRLTTGVRMRTWNTLVGTSCKFCAEPVETRNHLFFSVPLLKTSVGKAHKRTNPRSLHILLGSHCIAHHMLVSWEETTLASELHVPWSQYTPYGEKRTITCAVRRTLSQPQLLGTTSTKIFETGSHFFRNKETQNMITYLYFGFPLGF